MSARELASDEAEAERLDAASGDETQAQQVEHLLTRR